MDTAFITYIEKYETGSNSYTTSRIEDWVVKKLDKKFSSYDEAVEFAIDKNLNESWFKRQLFLGADRDQLINDMYTKHVVHCTWFVGKPQLALIVKALSDIGMIVYK